MVYTNIRYSTTLNDAQLDYLSDECQDINRMMCFKTFLRLAVLDQTKVTRKHFSAVLQPGQFMASKVELAMMWGCNRKTATRIIREFNLMGILQSEASNRTTIHTLKCLSVWFTNQRMVKNGYFVSNPIVKPVEKPDRTATHVPPENEEKTVVSEKDKTLLSDGTPIVQSVENNASIHHKGPEPNGITEQNLTHSFPLLSLAEQERDNDQPPSGLTVTDGLSGQSNYLLSTDTGMDEGTKPSPTENDQPSSRQCPALLQECSTIGKEKSSENVP